MAITNRFRPKETFRLAPKPQQKCFIRRTFSSLNSFIRSVLPVLISILALVISYTSAEVKINPQISLSAPDSGILNILNSIGVARPSTAIKLTNVGQATVNNVEISETNANVYFLFYDGQSAEQQVLTVLPALEAGRHATILLYPPNKLLNGYPPTEPGKKNQFAGTGKASFNLNYSAVVTNRILKKESTTYTEKISVEQLTDAALEKYHDIPSAIIPDTLRGKTLNKNLKKDTSGKSLAHTGP